MKTVHWQVPFQSYNGTAYRIDIYATGTVSTPEVLMGADGVFTTDEDNNDDYFTPVRTQTGTLRLVDPDGTLMERLLPQNNLDHPLRLVNVQTGAVEWQGFLGCEAYSQQYTARPQELTLSVISVLEAMKSAELDPSMGTLMKIRNMLYTVLHHVETAGQGDLTMLGNVYYPADSFRILFKFIDTAALFDQREICNENSVRYEVQGMSAHDVLERLCRFMGWTAHEVGQDIYLTKPGKGLYYVTLASLNTTAPDSIYEQYVQQPATIQPTNMRSLTYKGDNHKKSITQGAKAVEVVAKVEPYNMNINLPACPVGRLEEHHVALHNIRLYSLTNTNNEANSLMSFAYFVGRYQATKQRNPASPYAEYSISNIISGFSGSVYPMIPIAESILALGVASGFPASWASAGMNSVWSGGHTYNANNIDRQSPLFASLARCDFYEGDPKTAFNTQDGLFLSGLSVSPITSSSVTKSTLERGYALASIRSAQSLYAYNGWLNIAIQAKFISPRGSVGASITRNTLRFSLEYAGQYWNGTSWQSAFTTFTVNMKDGVVDTNKTDDMDTTEESGWFIPISSAMTGNIELRLFHEIEGDVNDTTVSYSNAFYAFITQLDVKYITPDVDIRTDRKENHYRKVLGLQFRDEVTIDCELASDLNNRPSPSLILNDSTHPMQRLTYTTASGNVDKRPEIELLERMEHYYGANRRTVELEVQESPNPASVVTGYDNLQYTPVAVKHDWQEDKTTVTCMETE